MVELSPFACRVIGALLEKERTVPATYPLTPKALLSACNQTTGREPVTTMTETQVDIAVRELREAKLARTVHASHGARTEKYRQVLDEALDLDHGERAVVTLLLLRGAQTPGELRSRSDRLHAFGSVDEVDRVLAALAARDAPLAQQLERRPGQKEQRWIHLLGTEADRAPGTWTGTGDAAAPVTSAGEGAPTDAVAASPLTSLAAAPLPAALAPIRAFVGTWTGTGTGEGHHADTEPFTFAETLTLLPVVGRPTLAYRSTAVAPDGTTLHDEAGFLRSLGDGSVELVAAQATGVVEVSEGLVDDRELILNSTLVAGTSTADPAGSTDRRYVADGDTLTYELSRSASERAGPVPGRPTALRITGTLTRPH